MPETNPKEESNNTESVEELKKALTEKDDKIGSLSSEIDELKAKVESLTDSLDSAIEEASLRGQTPEAEETEEEETSSGENVEEEEKETEAGEEEEGTETEPTVEKEIEDAIKEDRSFREDILLKEEMRDLREEIDPALAKYPKADRDEVLLDIYDGVEEDNPNQVEVLAKASHEKQSHMEEAIRKTFEEEYKAKLSKESEGGISVPQSPGSSKAPQSPPAPGVPPTAPQTEDSEWGEALKKAKVEGGGT